MQGLGERLRARARELGWSDAEVARRADLAQTRYANYVTDRHEPDLATLLRICSVLGTSPNDVLGTGCDPSGEAAGLQRRIAAGVSGLDAESLHIAAIIVDGLVARSASHSATDVNPKQPVSRRRLK